MPINNGTKRCVSVVLRDQKDLEHALRLLKRKLKRENFEILKNTIHKLPLPPLPEYKSEVILNIIKNDKMINKKMRF